ncbi:hypothetical protein NC651_024922 [Populus alba x Populus x berolinensis]|nr:hypothetical protein NC651_024922 [Populus alba x Populus x berolinensis]
MTPHECLPLLPFIHKNLPSPEIFPLLASLHQRNLLSPEQIGKHNQTVIKFNTLLCIRCSGLSHIPKRSKSRLEILTCH